MVNSEKKKRKLPARHQGLLWLVFFGSLASYELRAQEVVRTFELPMPESSLAVSSSAVPSQPKYEFEFARLLYRGGYEWPRWQADYPHAEFHFSNGLRRLTRIQVSNDSTVISLDSDELFDYPWLYAVEVGFLNLSESERAQLKEYLLRGGFFMVDDFHGFREWAHFNSVIKQIFPDRPLVSLSSHSALFDIHFDVKERIQIPGIRSVRAGRTWEKGGVTPGWFGMVDDVGRVMMVANFNQDLGDAWEHADDASYPEAFTSQAYRAGVNYVIYAMTH